MKQNTLFLVIFALAAAVILLTAAAVYFAPGFSSPPSPRWYSAAQAAAGEEIFTQNCLACHGRQGQAAADWQKRLPDGAFPPPPLNGTAHTWHHPLAALRHTIKKGGAQYGGSMPAFEDTLSDEEIEQVIAYFQSQWPEKIYRLWEEKVNRRE